MGFKSKTLFIENALQAICHPKKIGKKGEIFWKEDDKKGRIFSLFFLSLFLL